MPDTIFTRLRKGWNAFMSRDPTLEYSDPGVGYSYRPDRVRLTRGNEKTIATSVYNRISLDVAAINIRHARLDKNDRYKEDIKDGLYDCLTLQANIDQTSRAFIQDVVLSMLDEGCVAIVPVDTTSNPAPNSTLQRLIRKLALLDLVDEQSSSGKLDLIIQLPYVIKTEARRNQAEIRRKDIENQLSGSKYGIAYTDGTERITQLNRPLENNLLKQIEYLTNLFYSQLGITQTILDGTADEKTMLNYYDRTIEPIISAIVDSMRCKFLTKTARTQGQTILYFRDPFRLVPVTDIAEIADKFTRNEIATKNEIRQVIGWKPSDDPKADELRNSNISQSGSQESLGGKQMNAETEKKEEIQK